MSMTSLQLSAEQNSSKYNYYRNSEEKYITKAHARASICVYETQKHKDSRIHVSAT